MWLLLAACVLNRVGQSAPEAMRVEMAEHDRRLAEMEAVSEDVSRRLGQIEEITRARGQDEILKMETMEQLRGEVARVRGDFEVLQRDYATYEQAGLGYQQDADWRASYTETRIEAVEKSLGIRPPAPPPRDGGAPAVVDGTAPMDGAVPEVPPEEVPVAATPEETLALVAKNLADGKAGAARAIAKRFIEENVKSDRLPEAHYRIAESFQNEQDFASAAAAFQDVVDKYPTSTWAPWSILRQGECFASLGKTKEARLFWSDVVKKYPKSKAATEAKAHLAEK